MPESVRLAKCKSRNWTDIRNELGKKASMRALEFDSCDEIGLLWGLTPAGDVICNSVRKLNQLRLLSLSIERIIK
jgi:hypothetical protein